MGKRKATCPGCGAVITPAAGVTEVLCVFCGDRMVFEEEPQLDEAKSAPVAPSKTFEKNEQHTDEALCPVCGGTISREDKICPFCSSPLVRDSGTRKGSHRYQFVIPFSIGERDALKNGNLLFDSEEGSELKVVARRMFIPFAFVSVKSETDYQFVLGKNQKRTVEYAGHTMMSFNRQPMSLSGYQYGKLKDIRYYPLDVAGYDESLIREAGIIESVLPKRIQGAYVEEYIRSYIKDDLWNLAIKYSGDLELNTIFSNMSIPLGLCPLWEIELHNGQGLIKTVRVNGQSGKLEDESGTVSVKRTDAPKQSSGMDPVLISVAILLVCMYMWMPGVMKPITGPLVLLLTGLYLFRNMRKN